MELQRSVPIKWSIKFTWSRWVEPKTHPRVHNARAPFRPVDVHEIHGKPKDGAPGLNARCAGRSPDDPGRNASATDMDGSMSDTFRSNI